ncbi:MAG: extracellular solute-binding protein [Anaerolineales bacterium]|nr:extracellular solute-binding protein [Anaerolineales bacterium]
MKPENSVHPRLSILGAILILLLLLLPSVGCQAQPTLQQTPLPTPGTAVSPSGLATPDDTSSPQNVSTPPDSSSGLTLRIWLPPYFNPQAGTPAADLIQNHLQAFLAQNPDIRLDVRVKALDGPGGLLDSLASASAAAPLALPDLIALSRPLLESAALKGLLYPYDAAQLGALDDADWYPYIRELAYLQDSFFGLPFAGDALMLAYRPALLETPPADWEAVIALGLPLAFPAADPTAFYTLALYQAAGGAIQDNQGRPALDQTTLAQVLTFYQQAGQSGVMPYWLTQYETDDQAWTAFAESQSPMTVAWFSRYASQSSELPIIAAAAPLPTPEGRPFTLASGWVWAIATPDPARRAVSARLATFLVEERFLAEWTLAAGYLPPATNMLANWPDPSLRSLADQLGASAHLSPPAEILSSLGPVVEEAIIQVLKQQLDPQIAAQQALARLLQP